MCRSYTRLRRRALAHNLMGTPDEDLCYYESYLAFVEAIFPVQQTQETRLLDVGCGSGWSTYGFARGGYEATGIDLNAGAFEPPQVGGLTLAQANAVSLPFADASFEVVSSYQCLEHIPEPQRAIDEMIRVCKPRGVVCIVSRIYLAPHTR